MIIRTAQTGQYLRVETAARASSRQRFELPR
jgi:hypothetical protein